MTVRFVDRLNYHSRIVRTVVVAAGLGFAPCPVWAILLPFEVDQGLPGNYGSPGTGAVRIEGVVGQSFIPGKDSLDFVLLTTQRESIAPATAVLQVLIHHGTIEGPVIGTSLPTTVNSSGSLPNGGDRTIFEFGSSVPLTPGEPHVIEVVQLSGPTFTVLSLPDLYTNGSTVGGTRDLMFAEGPVATSCPTFVFPRPAGCTPEAGRGFASVSGFPFPTADTLVGLDATGDVEVVLDEGAEVHFDPQNGKIGAFLSVPAGAAFLASRYFDVLTFGATRVLGADEKILVRLHAHATVKIPVSGGVSGSFRTTFGDLHFEVTTPGTTVVNETKEILIGKDGDILPFELWEPGGGDGILALAASFDAIGSGPSTEIDGFDSFRFSFDLPVGVTVTSLLGFGANQVDPPPPGQAPTPATAWLFLAALLGFAGLRFRRGRDKGIGSLQPVFIGSSRANQILSDIVAG